MADFWNLILYSKCLYCSFLFCQLLLNEICFFCDEIILFNRIYLNEISRHYRFWWSWNVCMNIIICVDKWSVNLWHHSFTDTSVPLFDFVCGSLNKFNENCRMKRWAGQNTFITYLKVLWFLDVYLFITKNVIVLLTIQFES